MLRVDLPHTSHIGLQSGLEAVCLIFVFGTAPPQRYASRPSSSSSPQRRLYAYIEDDGCHRESERASVILNIITECQFLYPLLRELQRSKAYSFEYVISKLFDNNSMGG